MIHLPSTYEHLTTAEELLHQARQLLNEGRNHAAAGHTQLASAYLGAAAARGRIIPEPPPLPAARLGPLPEWCGTCDGPDLGLRWIQVTLPGDEVRMAKCPNCHPAAPHYTPATTNEEPLTTSHSGENAPASAPS
ncbi:hypothetical protein [Streptomyces albipurpureus]|uniref:Uncharacterized protein n=1 Tax=Streptomyces albipurpureus TaxID=2897419 RepID=A0ABT0UF20_9ACTN|nr:hypothetical protein [Streptomyces sp. CWNU-1]MCM2386717.1 hypothetical protein [Streptomyces sp. CWNU-1]